MEKPDYIKFDVVYKNGHQSFDSLDQVTEFVSRFHEIIPQFDEKECSLYRVEIFKLPNTL